MNFGVCSEPPVGQEMSEMTVLEALPGNDALKLLRYAVGTGIGERRISESMRSEAREDLIGQILNKKPKSEVY